MKPHFLPAQGLQRGVSLLEVMIAVVILSFGLLGLAGLQVTSLRNNQSAMERSLAVIHSYSIIDAMRADRRNAMAGAFNLDLDENPPAGNSFAAAQLSAWRTRLASNEGLGAGTSGAVSCDGAVCSITVRWDDERGIGGNDEQTLSTQIQL